MPDRGEGDDAAAVGTDVLAEILLRGTGADERAPAPGHHDPLLALLDDPLALSCLVQIVVGIVRGLADRLLQGATAIGQQIGDRRGVGAIKRGAHGIPQPPPGEAAGSSPAAPG